jgi:putative FmdB family regulatory protein
MPIYEFQCDACHNVWDELRKISDPVPEHCPRCNAGNVQQRMTAAGFRLKGGGWYETDFKSGSDSKRNLASDSSGSDSTSSTSEPAPSAPPATPAASAPAASSE